MQTIHKTAIISPTAQIGNNVEIGPYTIIGDNVVICDDAKIMSHVCIDGTTIVGEKTTIYPFAVIGFTPPDLKYQGENSKLFIGKNNVIREHVTIHIGTGADRNETVIGDDCLFMANSHVAHDCIVGNGVIMANNSALGGHVVVGDKAIIGGLSAVQQKVRVGAYSIIGGMSGLDADLAPFGCAIGNRAKFHGCNIIGMKRKGINNKDIAKVNQLFENFFDTTNGKNIEEKILYIKELYHDNIHCKMVIDFLQDAKSRVFCKP